MVTVTTMKPGGRRTARTPQHRFLIESDPWAIQPVMIAPVLPGETMRHLLLQSRVVSHPVAHPLIGWWQEYYFFYLKLRDLPYGQDGKPLDETFLASIENMVIDPSHVHAETVTANPLHYHWTNAPDWVGHCLKRVTEEYFRDDGEEWDDYLIGTLPAAKIMQDNAWNSLMPAADYTPIDVSVDTGVNSMAGDPHTHPISMKDLNEALERYQWDRLNNLTEMTFEDYVRTHGVAIRTDVEQHKPELIRYVRDWQYPTNTIEPASGVPSSALSWSIRERADKDRFFREPGFIFGCSVTRPKVYLSNQSGSFVGLLDRATAWLPALMSDDPFVGWRHVAKAAAGPAVASSITDANGYWFDIRDLYLHGDQFTNIAIANLPNQVAMPYADTEHKYADAADIEGLFRFVGASLGGDPETFEPDLQKIRQDGVVSLNISGVQRDHTARTSVIP